jgi:prepilin-type N-terminal cleavage/methylation domain-containing protein
MKHKGFTILEFLVVAAIMVILVGLILVGLTAARKNARDQAKISNLKTLVVGLVQYHDICRSYPESLDPSVACDSLQTQGRSLGDFIQNSNTVDFLYTGLADDPNDTTTCTGFHAGVVLEGKAESFSASKSSKAPQTNLCGQGVSVDPVDGTQANIFDIKK